MNTAQKICLLLSRRNIVTNGKFDNGTTGWTANNVTMAVVAGELQLTSTSTSELYASQTVNTVIGRRYTLTASLRAPASNSTLNAARIRIYPGPGLTGSPLASQSVTLEDSTQGFSLSFVATTATPFIQLGIASEVAWGASGDVAYFDNISIR